MDASQLKKLKGISYNKATSR